MVDNSINLDLPDSWVRVKLAELSKVITGNTPKKSQPKYYGGNHPFFKPTELNQGYYVKTSVDSLTENGLEQSRRIPAKSILVTCIGATIGKTGFSRVDGACNQQINAIVPSKLILPELIYFICISPDFQKSVINKSSSTTLPILNKSKFESLNVPLPPLAEQQRIVDKVEELFSDLDSGVNSLKTAQQQLKVYRQAVLKWAFEGKLTAQWREEQQRQGKLESADTLLAKIKAEREQRYQKELEVWQAEVEAWDAIGKEGKKPSKPKKPKELLPLDVSETETLKVLPELWQWVNFGELIQWGPQNGLYKSSNYYGKGTLIVRIDNFYDGKLNSYKTFKRLSVEEAELKLYQLQVNDILINRVNSMTYIGKCALVSSTPEDCVFESNIMRLKIFHDFISPKFITYYLSSPTGLKQLRKNAKQAVNQASINQTDVALSQVPLCSLAEQSQIIEEIESRLSICDQLEADIETNLKKTEALRQSILKQAFEGKLVPQDPNDEPASVLLERIRAEREAEKGNGKAKTRAKSKKTQLCEQIQLDLSTRN